MNVQKIISEEIQIIREDFDGNKLYGYHCTPCENLMSIKAQGFKIGTRGMQGTGVYGFYDLTNNTSGNAAVGYGQRHLGENFCVVKFEIQYPNHLLILIKNIAEDVLGTNADIITQISLEFDGWENYWEEIWKTLKSEYQTKEFEQKFIAELRKNFENPNDKELMFGTANLEHLNTFGVIYNGEYGIQYLIKAPRIMKPIGYHEVSRTDMGGLELSELKAFTAGTDKLKLEISTDPRYQDLLQYSIETRDDLNSVKTALEQKQNQVRNNRDYDELQHVLDLITDLEQQNIQEDYNDYDENLLSETINLLQDIINN